MLPRQGHETTICNTAHFNIHLSLCLKLNSHPLKASSDRSLLRLTVEVGLLLFASVVAGIRPFG